MAKSKWRRSWVKMWVDECLEGTIRFDFTSAERGVWYDLILLAGRCRVPGVISANETSPYPNSYIAGLLNIDLELLERTLEKCKASGRVRQTERGIELINWDHYQSEYERQKPYRQKGRAPTPEQQANAERQTELALAYRNKKKELGRDLTTEERLEVEKEVDKKLKGR